MRQQENLLVIAGLVVLISGLLAYGQTLAPSYVNPKRSPHSLDSDQATFGEYSDRVHRESVEKIYDLKQILYATRSGKRVAEWPDEYDVKV